MNHYQNVMYVTSLSISFISITTQLFGDFNSSLITLLIVMLIDFISGILASVYKSITTKEAAISSKIMFKGIIKKVFILFLVIISYRLDLLLHLDYIQTCIIISFIINEVLSILENCANLGIKIPAFFTKILSEVENSNNKKGEK